MIIDFLIIDVIKNNLRILSTSCGGEGFQSLYDFYYMQ
jgi:hypothetical protein